MKIKTSELTGPALDWAVAKCKDYNEIRVFGKSRPSDRGWIEVRFNPEPKAATARFDPSENWTQGGPIIEREKINVAFSRGEWWASKAIGYSFDSIGPTPLIVAMRCYVASKLGDEVEVPDELV